MSANRKVSRSGERGDVSLIDLLRPRFPHRDFWPVPRDSHLYLASTTAKKSFPDVKFPAVRLRSDMWE